MSTKSSTGPGNGKTTADGLERKGNPARGKRYSPAQRREILAYADNHRVCEAAEKFGVTEVTIYEWRRAMKRRASAVSAEATGVGEAPVREDEEPSEARDRKVLAMWRQHPGYGPSQIRNQLHRAGFKVSVATVRHVMETHGYLPPKLKPKEHVGRYVRSGTSARALPSRLLPLPCAQAEAVRAVHRG